MFQKRISQLQAEIRDLSERNRNLREKLANYSDYDNLQKERDKLKFETDLINQKLETNPKVVALEQKVKTLKGENVLLEKSLGLREEEFRIRVDYEVGRRRR